MMSVAENIHDLDIRNFTSEYVFEHISSNAIKILVNASNEEEAYEILKKMTVRHEFFRFKGVSKGANNLNDQLATEKDSAPNSLSLSAYCYCAICNKEDGKETPVEKMTIVNGTITFKLICGHTVAEKFS